MKKVGIVTMQGINYGNRLQNYALQEVLIKLGCECVTFPRQTGNMFKKLLRRILSPVLDTKITKYYIFNSQILWEKEVLNSTSNFQRLNDEYDFFIVGSDQVWNPLFHFNSNLEFLTFAEYSKRISYAASIGITKLPDEVVDKYKGYFEGIPSISVREKSAAKIVKDISGKTVPVVLDPVFLLSRGDWNGVLKKSKYRTESPYILMYYLGEEVLEYTNFVNSLSKKENLQVINIFGKYNCKEKAIGPSEFIDLIKNSSLICTDSFHATAFSIIMQRPFIVFKRAFQEGYGDMSSRLDSLLEDFKLEDREYSKLNMGSEMHIDYKIAEIILESKKRMSLEFLSNALSIHVR